MELDPVWLLTMCVIDGHGKGGNDLSVSIYGKMIDEGCTSLIDGC